VMNNFIELKNTDKCEYC